MKIIWWMGFWQQPHDHINGLDHPAQDPDRFNGEHYLSTLTRHADGQRSFFDFFNPTNNEHFVIGLKKDLLT